MTSAWHFKDTLRTETKDFLISKLGSPWPVYTLTPSNSTHYYLISSKLPFNAETTKFPGEKKTTENLRMYYVTWQSTLGEIVNSHWREYSFILRFKLVPATGYLVNSGQLWFLSGTIIDEQSASKTGEGWPCEWPFTKRGSVAVYSRSLRAYRKKRTSPICLKIKRNCIITLDFSISIHIIILQ